MMTFDEKIEAAGFEHKKHFAQYIGRDAATVSRWGNSPPLVVTRLLDVHIGIKTTLDRIQEE